MPGGKRLWRTEDGRLVEDGHPDAVLLAYGTDDELADEDRAKAKPEKVEGSVTPKATKKAASKPS